MPGKVKTFCPYDNSPDPVTCPPGGGTGWRCRALQEDGTCLRLEAERALAWIGQNCIEACGSRIRVATKADEREAM